MLTSDALSSSCSLTSKLNGFDTLSIVFIILESFSSLFLMPVLDIFVLSGIGCVSPVISFRFVVTVARKWDVSVHFPSAF